MLNVKYIYNKISNLDINAKIAAPLLKQLVQKVISIKEKTLYIAFILVIAILALSIKGMVGNPSITELNTSNWKEDGPLELSPDRGRYALMYSVVEDHTLYFSKDVARLAAPDLGFFNGNFVSLFAPGVSFLIIPGYVIGKALGAAQLGTYAVITFIAFINVLLIIEISKKLGANKYAAVLAALAFLFGTNAFAYGVSLYQHHVTLLLILISLYAIVKWDNYKTLLVISFTYFLAISVDYPNAIILLPFAIYAVTQVLKISKETNKLKMVFRPLYTLCVVTAIPAIAFFFWFNKTSYGNPLQLAGTVVQVQEFDKQGNPIVFKDENKAVIKENLDVEQETESRNTLHYFETREMLNGLYILFLSPDRGFIFFAPVMILAFYGMAFLQKSNKVMHTLLLGVSGLLVCLYAMWGDVWGGWAFGPRYLVPVFGILAIYLAIALSNYKKSFLFVIAFVILFDVSAYINTAGALTSNAMPPKVEILALEKTTNKVQRYTVQRNLDTLSSNISKSAGFVSFAHKHITAWQYFWIIYGLISSTFVLILLKFVKPDHEK